MTTHHSVLNINQAMVDAVNGASSVLTDSTGTPAIVLMPYAAYKAMRRAALPRRRTEAHARMLRGEAIPLDQARTMV